MLGNCYTFFLGWSFDHYVVAFFVSFHNLCFKVYFIWYEYCYSCFLLVSICMESFSSPSLSVCMCPLFWGGSLVDNIYRSLVFVSMQPGFVFWLGHSTHLHLRQLLISIIPLPSTLSFWVWVYTPFLCTLSREDPLAFLESCFGGAEISQLLLICKAFDFSFVFEWDPCWVQ